MLPTGKLKPAIEDRLAERIDGNMRYRVRMVAIYLYRSRT